MAIRKALFTAIIICSCMQLGRSQDKSAESWKDPATGLIWALKDNGADVGFMLARDYCTNLRTGGFSDWRLATIDELEGIYDSKSKQLVKIKGSIQLGATGVWSGSSIPSGEVWSFYFNYGGRSPMRTQGHSTTGRALCVRVEK
jgi:hypothetical protein